MLYRRLPACYCSASHLTLPQLASGHAQAMRNKIVIQSIAFALSACGSGSRTFDHIAEHTWASRAADCGNSFTTFSRNTIRFHRLDGGYDFGRIVQVRDAAEKVVGVTVEPSNEIKEAAKRGQPSKRLPDAMTMGLELDGSHLKLVAIFSGDHGEIGGPVLPQSVEYRLFDLLQCER